jgi:hypothetical protein
MMRSRLAPFLLAFTLLAGLFVVPAAASAVQRAAAPQAAPTAQGFDIPITLPGTIGGLAGAFNGTFTLTKFVLKDGQVLARGVLNGVVTQAGQTVGTLTNFKVDLPLAPLADPAVCDILHLTLGPLHLNLLGLVVDLNRVVLDITAQPGPGNLLGNLLCAVAGLLDPGGLLGGGLSGIVKDILKAINDILKM